MGENEMEVILALIAFHGLLIGLVRTFSLNFSKNLLEILYKISKERGGRDCLNSQESYKKIKMYRYWEGGVMYFCCSFWIWVILIGVAYILKKFKPCLDFNPICFVLMSMYMVFVFITICIQWEYVSERLSFLIFTIIGFYVIPSLIFTFRNYLIKIVTAGELSIIYCLWGLSLIYFIFWHFLLAFFAPLSQLRKLMGEDCF